MTIEERYAAAERTLDVQRARRLRRTPAVLVAVIGGLVLLVAITAAIDLRRLQTPRGAALAWTEAATLGECRGYLALSRPVDQERRSDDQICRALRARTADVHNRAVPVRIRALRVTRDGRTAAVDVRVTKGDATYDAHLTLVRRGAKWRVLRDTVACGTVGCA